MSQRAWVSVTRRHDIPEPNPWDRFRCSEGCLWSRVDLRGMSDYGHWYGVNCDGAIEVQYLNDWPPQPIPPQYGQGQTRGAYSRHRPAAAEQRPDGSRQEGEAE